MTKQDLLAKRALYEAKRAEVSMSDNAEEIEAKVAEYRKQLEQEYATEQQNDITKINNYLDLLDELIADVEQQEQLVANEATV